MRAVRGGVSPFAGGLAALPEEYRRARSELGRAFGLLKHLFEMPLTASYAERLPLALSKTTRDARAAIQYMDASVDRLLDELASIREDLATTARRLVRLGDRQTRADPARWPLVVCSFVAIPGSKRPRAAGEMISLGPGAGL